MSKNRIQNITCLLFDIFVIVYFESITLTGFLSIISVSWVRGERIAPRSTPRRCMEPKLVLEVPQSPENALQTLNSSQLPLSNGLLAKLSATSR